MRKKSDRKQSASGTEIIEELGEEEIQTGAMIVYTSADSVLQFAEMKKLLIFRICTAAVKLQEKLP